MRRCNLVVVLAVPCVLSACGEVQSGRYPTWSDANNAQLIKKGWIPELVPRSATSIIESHNLDLNTQWVEFVVPVADVGPMVKGLAPVSKKDASAARAMVESASWVPEQATKGYVVCDGFQPGVLVVSPTSGSAVFAAPAKWAADDCRDSNR